MKKILISMLAIGVLASGCSFQKDTLTLEGYIQNNIISANSTVAGKIVKMNKQQGEPVKKGEVIAVIDESNQKYAVEQLQALVKMKKAKLEELQAGTRPQQLKQAEAQVRAAKAQLDLVISGNRAEQIAQAKNNVSIAQEAFNTAQATYDYVNTQYKNILELYKEGTIAKSELDSAKYKLDTAAKQLSSAKYQLNNSKEQLTLLQKGSTSQAINAARANYDAASAQLELLKSGPTAQAITAAQADLEQSVAQLKQAQNNLKNCTITASADGIIISKNYELGDVVNVGSTIADIAIADDLYVLAYIPTEYLDKIYYNQPLAVTTSLGVQSGRVSYIALKHEYTPKDKQSTSDSKRIATKIKVAIKDKKGILKSGMTATIEVPLRQ